MNKQPLTATDRAALCERLAAELGRAPLSNEEVNMENDALLLARYALDKVNELEKRTQLLETPKI